MDNNDDGAPRIPFTGVDNAKFDSRKISERYSRAYTTALTAAEAVHFEAGEAFSRDHGANLVEEKFPKMHMLITGHAKIFISVTALWSAKFKALYRKVCPITATRVCSTRSIRVIMGRTPKLDVREREFSLKYFT